MKLHHRLLSVFSALSLAAAPMAMAEMNQTQATIVDAAVGGVVGSMSGNDMQSTLIGAAAGGLLGNLLSQSSRNYSREGRYNNRYYYGGREFDQQNEYLAYRDAVRRNQLAGKERSRYQDYRRWQRQYAQAQPTSRGNSQWGHQQGRHGHGHHKHSKHTR